MTAHTDPIHANASAGRRAMAMVDEFFAAMGQGFNAYLLAQSRMHEIRALNAKTDAELAEMGLTRERIPHHVFGDLF